MLCSLSITGVNICCNSWLISSRYWYFSEKSIR